MSLLEFSFSLRPQPAIDVVEEFCTNRKEESEEDRRCEQGSFELLIHLVLYHPPKSASVTSSELETRTVTVSVLP